MKIYIRNAFFFILAAIIVLFTVTCIDPEDTGDKKDDDDITYGPVHFDMLDIKGEQVWIPNKKTGKVSQMFLKYTDDSDVDVIVELIDDSESNPVFNIKQISSGKIEKGILSFKVNVMNDGDLLDSNNLLYYYFNEWYYDKDNKININMNPKIKGNIITLVTEYDESVKIPTEAIIREGFSGTYTSLTGEYIYYLYVDNDCTISAKKVDKAELEYTFNDFNLTLKRGWNTICKSETYTTSGKSSYSITVKNPGVRWLKQEIN
jgi:hypothetical protein